MKRSTPLLRKTPLKPGGPIRRHNAALKPRKTRLKKSVLRETVCRNPAYLAAVRTIDCVNCGRHGHTQAAHSNQLRFGKGGRLKASDATAMALCSFPAIGVSGCHEILDQGGAMIKEARNQFEYQMIVLTALHLIAEGKLVGSVETTAAIKSAYHAGFEQAAMIVVHAIENNLLQVAK